MSVLLSSTLANESTSYFALAGSGIEFVTGMIMIFNGQVAPEGWTICDGTNGTPDLRNRFVNGAGTSFPYGQPGGATTTSLVLNNLPDHIHATTLGPINAGVTGGSGAGYGVDNTGTNTTGITSPGYTAPGGTPFSIMPPSQYLSHSSLIKK